MTAKSPKSDLLNYLERLQQMGEGSDYEKDEVVVEMESNKKWKSTQSGSVS